MLYGHLAHLIETPKSDQSIITLSDRQTIRPIFIPTERTPVGG